LLQNMTLFPGVFKYTKHILIMPNKADTMLCNLR